MSLGLKQKIKKQLLQGGYSETEKEFYQIRQTQATQEWQAILTEVTQSQAGHDIALKLRKKYAYGIIRKQRVTITTLTGEQIQIPTWYTLRPGKKKGKAKKGPNGRGDHLLLRYWGFISKQSPNYTSRVTRQGVACQSYELASQELGESGIKISDRSVNMSTQKVGQIASQHRPTIALEPGETFKDKRLVIAIDGGRVRIREKKSGRYSKQQKRARFNTHWREPKLLVIAEFDDQGKYKKGTKPIYEATMQNHHQLFYLLYHLAQQTDIKQAHEIILSGDGARWIWDKFDWLVKELGINHKTTQILDFYHACEHLDEIVEANTSFKPKQKKQWFKLLKSMLREGCFKALKQSIENESQEKNIPRLMKLFQYFERNQDRIHYERYEQNNQPIGSGIVESAIRRVINLKLKSPSIFWRLDNLERMLQLRCILMAGRWKTLFKNILKIHQFQLD